MALSPTVVRDSGGRAVARVHRFVVLGARGAEVFVASERGSAVVVPDVDVSDAAGAVRVVMIVTVPGEAAPILQVVDE